MSFSDTMRLLVYSAVFGIVGFSVGSYRASGNIEVAVFSAAVGVTIGHVVGCLTLITTHVCNWAKQNKPK